MNGVSLARFGWHTQASITCLEGWNHWRGQAQDVWPHWEQGKAWPPPWTTQTEWEEWLPWHSRGALARKMKKRCWTREKLSWFPSTKNIQQRKSSKIMVTTWTDICNTTEVFMNSVTIPKVLLTEWMVSYSIPAQTSRRDVWTQKGGKGWLGWNGRLGLADIHYHVKQTASGKLLYSTWSSAQGLCDDLDGWEGGSTGRGMCIATAETNTEL